MCLPSGKTPVNIYAEMSRSVRAGLVSFARASVFALDEFGGIAPDDPGSTRQMLQRQLIDGVDLPASGVSRSGSSGSRPASSTAWTTTPRSAAASIWSCSASDSTGISG